MSDSITECDNQTAPYRSTTFGPLFLSEMGGEADIFESLYKSPREIIISIDPKLNKSTVINGKNRVSMEEK